MADEISTPQVEAPEPELQDAPESEASAPKERDWEAEARSLGWSDKHDGPDKVDAREFVLRKPLFDQIHTLKKKTREFEAALKHQRMVQDKLLEQERHKVMQELTQQKVKAIEDGDAQKVLSVEKEMADREKAFAAAKPVGPPPEFTEFVEANEWYEKDNRMRLFADALGNDLFKQNPNKPLKQLYAEVAAAVKEEFPHKFSNPNRGKPSAVDGVTPNANASGKGELGWDDIPREYRRVAESQWKAGAFVDKLGKPLSKRDAMRQYAEELKKVGMI